MVARTPWRSVRSNSFSNRITVKPSASRIGLLQNVLTLPACWIAWMPFRFPRSQPGVHVRFRLLAITPALLLLPVLLHPAFAQNAGRGNAGRGNAAPAPVKPTPRWPDGTVNWGSPIGE